MATILTDSGQKNGAWEGAESRRGCAEKPDFPLECLNQIFTTVGYDNSVFNKVPFSTK
jgi:hypothetical protein